MTAFAAIVAPGPDPRGINRVAAALSRIYGIPATVLTLDGVALLAAPLGQDNDPQPYVDEASGVAAVGQVLLEDHDGLAAALGIPATRPALALCVAAFLRWGPAATARLSGEFAFVLWNARARTLLCARDGLGVRQLYCAVGRDVSVITNALGASLAHPAISDTLDERCLIRFLVEGGPDEGRTPYRDVTPIPAGHTLILSADRSTASLGRHWFFPHGAAPRRREREVPERYREILQQAVRDRLRASRASILLSGGVDSTTIAAAAKAAAPAVALHAFTAVYDRVPRESEWTRAQAAANMLGIPVTRVLGDRHAALHALEPGAPPLPQPLDEPSLSDWRALVGAAAAHSQVALYGEDGDSLLLPPGYAALRQMSPLAPLIADVWRYLAHEHRLPYLGLRVRERLRLTRPLPGKSTPAWLTSWARSMLAPREGPTLFSQRPAPLPAHPGRPRTQQRLGAAISEYLATILSPEVTGQRIELRCPLLDTRVIRFVMDIPAIPWCQHKRLPREAYRNLLPRPVLERPKQGVAGLDAALMRDWQRSAPRRPQGLPPPLNGWIEPEAWQRALNDSNPVAVAAAWRGLQLAAWLNRRREATVVEDEMCTA